MNSAQNFGVCLLALVSIFAGCSHGELAYFESDASAEDVPTVGDAMADLEDAIVIKPTCAVGNGGCPENSRCHDTDGGVVCVCNDGFVRNGGACVDVDECLADPPPCEPGLICVNKTPGFACLECPNGLTMDEKDCRWISQSGSRGFDWPWDIAVDGDGNTLTLSHVNGRSKSLATAAEETVVAKTGPNGETIWTSRRDNDTSEFFGAIETAPSGRFFVVGELTEPQTAPNQPIISDGFVAGYEPDGTRRWITVFGTPKANDGIWGIAVHDDAVYVVGAVATAQKPEYRRPMVAKLDFSGKVQWKDTLEGSRGICEGATVDDWGNVYVVGEVEGKLNDAEKAGGGRDLFLARYDSDGNRKWLKQFPWSGRDDFHYMAADHSGRLYITGSTSSDISSPRVAGSGADLFVLAVDPDGSIVWNTRFDTGSSQGGTGLAIVDDTIWITGSVLGKMNDFPYIRAGYDAVFELDAEDGEPLRAIEVSKTAEEGLVRIRQAADGDARISTMTYMALPDGGTKGDPDVALSRIDRNHNLVWEKAIDQTVGAAASDIGIAVDGSAYVVGNSVGNVNDETPWKFGYQAFIKRINKGGATNWSRQMNLGPILVSPSLAVQDKLVLVAYTTSAYSGYSLKDELNDIVIMAYDLSGNEKATRTLLSPGEDKATDIAAGTAGAIFVAGSSSGELGGTSRGGYDAIVGYLDKSLNPKLWIRLGSAKDDQFAAVAPYPDGGVVAVGQVGETPVDGEGKAHTDIRPGVIAARYDAAGGLVWLKQISAGKTDTGYDIAADAEGNIFVTGSTGQRMADEYSGRTDIFVVRMDANGHVAWTRQFGTPGQDEGHGIQTFNGNELLITGFTEGALACTTRFTEPYGGKDAIYIRMLSDGTGEASWLASSAGDDSAEHSAVDPDGKIMIAGWTDGNFDGMSPYEITNILVVGE